MSLYSGDRQVCRFGWNCVPRLCGVYNGICLTTEEKQGKTSVRV